MANGKTCVFDTNVLVYFFQGDINAGKLIEDFNVAVSAITSIELLSNAKHTLKEKELVKDFLEGITPVQTNPSIVDLAIKFRLSYSLLVADALIAATAKYLDTPLITSDKAFFKIKEIQVIPFSK